MSGIPPPPRVQPPPPVFAPPSTSYRNARQEELEELRRKGLAKIFNKHFTTVADKIRQEHKAAELALTEIIKRKEELAANPNTFNDNGLTLTQLDKLHMELKKRKKEVQIKEKETQELYKRYCNQYGNSNEHVPSPDKINDLSILPTTPAGMGEVFRQDDLMLAKAMDCVQATKDADVNKLVNQLKEGASSLDLLPDLAVPVTGWSPPNVKGHAHAYDNVALDGYATGRSPPRGKKQDTSMMTMDTAASSPTPEHSNDGARHAADVIPTTSPSIGPAPAQDQQHYVLPSGAASVYGNASVLDQSLYLRGQEDDDSDVSGLTDIDGATVAEAEWKLTEFLKQETDNIKSMFNNQGDEDGEEEAFSGVFSQSANSIISGEQERVAEAAKEAEDMVQQMAEATAWMNDPTMLEEEESEDGESSEDDEDSVPKPEWCSFWSENHQREYYFNTQTNQTCWTRPQGVEIDFTVVAKTKSETESTNPETRSVTANNNVIHSPTEEEKVAVKDFTKGASKIKGRSLFKENNVSATECKTNEEMVKVFRPDSKTPKENASVESRGSSKTSSKVLEYRRKRARIARKKKRLTIAAAAFAAIVGGIVLYSQWGRRSPATRDDSVVSRKAELDKASDELKMKEMEAEHKRRMATEELKRKEEEVEMKRIRAAEELRRKEEEVERKRIRAEEELKRKEEEAERKRVRAVEEQKRKEEERLARKAAEADRKEIESEKKRIEVEEKRVKAEAAVAEKRREELRRMEEELERKASELKRMEDEEIARKEEEQRQKELEAEIKAAEEAAAKAETERIELEAAAMQVAAREENNAIAIQAEKRPWGCNMPFTYLISRKCWHMATEKPIYDCQGITDFMMQ